MSCGELEWHMENDPFFKVEKYSKAGRKTKFPKAKDMTVMLLVKNPEIRATQVLEYLNMYLEKDEVPSIQHIARNWVIKDKPTNTLTWIQMSRINKQIAIVQKEFDILKEMINGQ